MSDASIFKIKGEGNTVDTPEAGQCIDGTGRCSDDAVSAPSPD